MMIMMVMIVVMMISLYFMSQTPNYNPLFERKDHYLLCLDKLQNI